MGREVVVTITDGRFDDSAEPVEVFGPWEQISYGELGGRRRKRVLVKLIGEYERVWVPFEHLATREQQGAECLVLR